MRLVDDEGNIVAHDGESAGRLLVKGPWVIKRYYRDDVDCVDADGWFDTGDIATIDEHGYMHVIDRRKDLIKSGGEWISSVELETLAGNHPAVAAACAVGVADPQWDERPWLYLQLERDSYPEDQVAEEVRQNLLRKVPKFWLPDQIHFLDELPRTATGKVNKLQVRELANLRQKRHSKQS